ncbi:MAG TPA: transposase [Pyrinomonadaceae bacterium]|nr:transposase [Pyrinomonadaceae bacterium]
MNPLGRYPVLSTLLRPFRLSQRKTCAAIVSALCQAAQASSFAIAGQLSCLTEVQFGSALTRLYRFLRNERFDNWLLTEQLLRLLGSRPGPLLLALDWTAWQDRFSVLTASVCAGTRSIPVAVSACRKPQLARSQNLWEETFLRLTVDRLRSAGVSAVWLCDRGFHRVKWLEKFVEFEQQFVVRLTRDVTVRLTDRVCLLKSLELRPGERRDFGWVWLRADELVRVRLIGVWAEGAKEAWWLATNLGNRVSKVVSYYDRRMGIEEQFRDAKGQRFGMKLRWTQFTRAEFVERIYLLVGVALLLWTVVGRAVEEAEPKVRLASKTKGARLSLARIGSYYWRQLSRQLRLTAQFVREHLPPPRLRMFKWLMAPQK